MIKNDLIVFQETLRGSTKVHFFVFIIEPRILKFGMRV